MWKILLLGLLGFAACGDDLTLPDAIPDSILVGRPDPLPPPQPCGWHCGLDAGLDAAP